jgi:4-hydroxybenzoate polyprenyltransferase
MTRLRLIVLVIRPAVLVLLAMFTATGLAQAGQGRSEALLARALIVVFGFLLFSVACNDIADEAIDRVNLPGQRPLAAGVLGRAEFAVIGVVSGVVALAASVTLRWQAVIVTAAGLAISAGYSLRPVRLADRGAVAAMVLPACYVGVPFLTGIFAARDFVRPDDLLLLAGLYLGFIGRILLKDFRDVRGDALFGKRTFLVRHGRRWTCAFSAGCWTAGMVMLLAAVHRPTPALAVGYAGCLAGALWLLRKLAAAPGGRRDECLISAIAIIGRGVILLLLAHLSMIQAGWSGRRYVLVIGALAVLTAGLAATMARHGPITRSTVPFGPAPAAALGHDEDGQPEEHGAGTDAQGGRVAPEVRC